MSWSWGNLLGTELTYAGDADTVDVQADLGVRDVSARLDITDIPRDTKVCIGKEKWINYDVVRVGG
jgi:hypothetical protein